MDLFKAFGIYKMPPMDPRNFPGHTLDQGKAGQPYGIDDSGPHLNASEVAYQNAHLSPTIVHGRIGTDQPQHHAWIEFKHPETRENLVYDPKTRLMGTHKDMYEDPLRSPENDPHPMPKYQYEEGEWTKHPLLTPRHKYSMGELDILYNNRGDQMYRDNIDLNHNEKQFGFPFSREERSVIPRLNIEDDNEDFDPRIEETK